MYSVSVQNLREGDRYSGPLYVEGSVFLPAYMPITSKDLKVLEELAVTEIVTEGENLSASPLPPVIAPEPEEPQEQQARQPEDAQPCETEKKLGEIIKLLDSIFEIIAVKKVVQPRVMWTIVGSLLQLIKKSRQDCIDFILGNNVEGCDFAKSAINIAILTALISMEKGMDDRMIPELVSAALLHDAGMLRLPKLLLSKKMPLSGEEKLAIQGHTISSYNIARDELNYPLPVCAAILQHHERWDGLGYPQRITGGDIDEGACIIAIADSFEAMVSIKPYRNSMTAYQAMKMMMSENASHFSPNALQAFVKVMGIYPIGSGVVLNNGAHARIVDNNKDAPLRPVLKIVAGSSGDPLTDGETIDLLKNKTLYIITTFDIGKH